MTSGAITNTAGIEATDRLNKQLTLLARQGWLPRCTEDDKHLWTSDWEGERAHAIELCQGCVVILECRTAAEFNGEKHHVWGGKSFDRRPAKLGRPPKT